MDNERKSILFEDGAMRMAYISDELFHFVGHNDPENHEANYRTLKKILKAKCISYPPHTLGWGKESYTYNPSYELLKEDMLIPEVVCFGDIPFESLNIHLKKYGLFGLALRRDYLIMSGARPVMYLPYRDDDWASIYGKTLLKDIEEIYRSLRKHTQNLENPEETRYIASPLASFESALKAAESMIAKDFLAFIKPFNSQLEKNHDDNFYMEREWRRLGNVCFKVEHITKIVVKKGYCVKLRRALPDYAHLVVEV